jgi:hypothetical protein
VPVDSRDYGPLALAPMNTTEQTTPGVLTEIAEVNRTA